MKPPQKDKNRVLAKEKTLQGTQQLVLGELLIRVYYAEFVLYRLKEFFQQVFNFAPLKLFLSYDRGTRQHAMRSALLTLRLARAMRIPSIDLFYFLRGALLHDIGKSEIPSKILNKAGKLNKSERKIIQRHANKSFKRLKALNAHPLELEIARFHHERWDGGGYPSGLKKKDIPLSARIFSVADVWDALVSDRPYRSGWMKEQALAYIRAEQNKHFDSQVVEKLARFMREKVSFMKRQVQLGRRQFAMRVLVLFGLIPAIMLSSTGVALAAQSSLPGELLYTIKAAIEESREQVAITPLAGADLQLQFARSRLAEVGALLDRGRGQDALLAAQSFEDDFASLLATVCGSLGEADAEQFVTKSTPLLIELDKQIYEVADRLPAQARARLLSQVRAANLAQLPGNAARGQSSYHLSSLNGVAGSTIPLCDGGVVVLAIVEFDELSVDALQEQISTSAQAQNLAANGKPDDTPGKGKPDETAANGKPDDTPGKGKPDETAANGKPDDTPGGGKPDDTPGGGQSQENQNNGQQNKPAGKPKKK